MRRAGILFVLLLTLFAAGCGGDKHEQAVTPLDDAVGYFAKDAPFVAAVETDPNGSQIKQVSEIAEQMHLSVKTVSTYRTRLLDKMGMSTNAELTRYAIENGLV